MAIVVVMLDAATYLPMMTVCEAGRMVVVLAFGHIITECAEILGGNLAGRCYWCDAVVRVGGWAGDGGSFGF